MSPSLQHHWPPPARRVKVYGWYGHRKSCPASPNGSQQTREIVATTSQVEAARIAGVDGRHQLWNLTETGNAGEIAQATSEPGVVFWKPGDHRGEDGWRRAEVGKPWA